MAVRKLHAQVGIDGEKEYKAALSELNNGNRVLASEMRKLQAEYKGNENSVEALTAKGDLLQRQLLQQKDKVETLREAVKNAARQKGEDAAETQAWIVKLNNAEAAQYDLQHAIEANDEALEKAKSGVGDLADQIPSLGDSISGLAEQFGVNLPSGITKSLDSMQGFSSGTVLAMSAAAAGVAALAKVVSELHDITQQAAADVDEILTESMTTGLSTRTIQQLKYAENLIDVSYSTITDTLTRLTRNMDAARDGNEELANSFARLGVSITDETTGQLRNAEDVLWELLDPIGQIEGQTERDAAAMELLGKSAQELNPLFNLGTEGAKEFFAEIEAGGLILDESQLKKLGEVDDAYQKLQIQIDATKKELAVQFAPASKAAMETFANVTKAAGDTLARSGLVDGLADILASLTGLLEPLAELLGITPGLTNELRPLYEILHAIAGVFALIADVGNAAIGILTLNPTKFNTALGLNAQYGMYSNMQRWDTGSAGFRGRSSYEGWEYDPETGLYSGNYVPGNAAGVQNWRGGLTYLSENGPEAAILPRGTQILNAQDTRGLGGDTYYITIDAKNVREFNDIVEIARTARVRGRMK